MPSSKPNRPSTFSTRRGVSKVRASKPHVSRKKTSNRRTPRPLRKQSPLASSLPPGPSPQATAPPGPQPPRCHPCLTVTPNSFALGFDPQDPVLNQHIPTSTSYPQYCTAEGIVQALRAAELQAALGEVGIHPLTNGSCSSAGAICLYGDTNQGGDNDDNDCLANVDASLDDLIPPPRNRRGLFAEFAAIDALDIDDDGVLREIQFVMNASGEAGVVEVLRPRGSGSGQAESSCRRKGGYSPIYC